MARKIIQVGNSLAVTIPRDFVKKIEAETGASVTVDANSTTGRMVVDFPMVLRDSDNVVDTEVYKAAKGLLKRYLPAFKELARK